MIAMRVQYCILGQYKPSARAELNSRWPKRIMRCHAVILRDMLILMGYSLLANNGGGIEIALASASWHHLDARSAWTKQNEKLISTTIGKWKSRYFSCGRLGSPLRCRLSIKSIQQFIPSLLLRYQPQRTWLREDLIATPRFGPPRWVITDD